jgi:hypothetical protein
MLALRWRAASGLTWFGKELWTCPHSLARAGAAAVLGSRSGAPTACLEARKGRAMTQPRDSVETPTDYGTRLLPAHKPPEGSSLASQSGKRVSRRKRSRAVRCRVTWPDRLEAQRGAGRDSRNLRIYSARSAEQIEACGCPTYGMNGTRGKAGGRAWRCGSCVSVAHGAECVK